MTDLRGSGEFALIEAIRARVDSLAKPPGVRVGIGDDAAVLEPMEGPTVVTCDTLVEGVHFRLDRSSGRLLGRKCLAVNLSDIAAMGAVPRAAIVMMSLRADLPREVFDGLVDGLAEMAAEHDVAIVGGDTTRIEGPAVVSITVIGEAVHAPLLRSGASVGDRVYVTGTLGDSAMGLRVLLERPEERTSHNEVVSRHLDPSPRVAVGLYLSGPGRATAAIDVSDGLVQDAGHVARASGHAIRIDLARVPVSPAFRTAARALAIQDTLTPLVAEGEDYELLFTIPPDRELPEVIAGTRVTRVGEVVDGVAGEVTLVAPDGKELVLSRKGWQHF